MQIILFIVSDFSLEDFKSLNNISSNGYFAMFDLAFQDEWKVELGRLGVPFCLYEGMVNGMRNSNFGDLQSRIVKQNRVQAPFVSLEDGSNLGSGLLNYVNDLGIECDLESELMYSDDNLRVLEILCSEGVNVFSRELDVNGRLVNFQNGKVRSGSNSDFDDFKDYLSLVSSNILNDECRLPERNLPQLGLDYLVFNSFLSGLLSGDSSSDFSFYFGGKLSADYMPKLLPKLEKFYGDVLPILNYNGVDLPKNPKLCFVNLSDVYTSAGGVER